MSEQTQVDDQILQLLGPDEPIRSRTRTVDGEVIVTDRLLIVTANERLALNVAIDAIRYIQLENAAYSAGDAGHCA